MQGTNWEDKRTERTVSRNSVFVWLYCKLKLDLNCHNQRGVNLVQGQQYRLDPSMSSSHIVWPVARRTYSPQSKVKFLNFFAKESNMKDLGPSRIQLCSPDAGMPKVHVPHPVVVGSHRGLFFKRTFIVPPRGCIATSSSVLENSQLCWCLSTVDQGLSTDRHCELYPVLLASHVKPRCKAHSGVQPLTDCSSMVKKIYLCLSMSWIKSTQWQCC